MATIGVLSLQGGFSKHKDMLDRISCPNKSIRAPEDLEGIDGIILPGGESTTLGMLIERVGLTEPLKNLLKTGFPFFGTCAGMILLSQKVHGRNPLHLNGLDIEIDRNAYGSQTESFEAEIDVQLDSITKSMTGIFIRAPRIRNLGPSVQVLAQFNDAAVLVQQDKVLAASFHPELSNDPFIHDYFVSKLCN